MGMEVSWQLLGIGVLAALEGRPVIPPSLFPSKSEGTLRGFINTEWKPKALSLDLDLPWISSIVLNKSLCPCGLQCNILKEWESGLLAIVSGCSFLTKWWYSAARPKKRYLGADASQPMPDTAYWIHPTEVAWESLQSCPLRSHHSAVPTSHLSTTAPPCLSACLHGILRAITW